MPSRFLDLGPEDIERLTSIVPLVLDDEAEITAQHAVVPPRAVTSHCGVVPYRIQHRARNDSSCGCLPPSLVPHDGPPSSDTRASPRTRGALLLERAF